MPQLRMTCLTAFQEVEEGGRGGREMSLKGLPASMVLALAVLDVWTMKAPAHVGSVESAGLQWILRVREDFAWQLEADTHSAPGGNSQWTMDHSMQSP